MSGKTGDPPGPFGRALRIGLVGPIACGKSTVAGWIAETGATVIDADRLARTVLDPGGSALDEVFATFGDGLRLADGALDRAALGAIVFADPDALARLEAIVHPAVRPLILAALDGAPERYGDGLVVLEAIRLVDGGYASLMDETWFVTCAPDIQRARLAARGIEGEDADRRIAAQRDLLERAQRAATRVVDTSGSLEGTRAAVLAALAEARAARRGRPR